MVKSKWISALLGVLAVSVLSIGAVRADDSCKGHESRITDLEKLEKKVAELEEIIRQMPIPPVQIKACNDSSTSLRSVAVGFKCRTSKGAIYERVARDNFGESWKDSDGLIWSDYIGSHSQRDAVSSCLRLSGKLPAPADFKRGEANGFREVLPNMKDRWFWSSSVHPYDSDNAYGFNGYIGDIDYYNRIYNNSVRCVGR